MTERTVMALVNCPSCKEGVSEAAKACPGCGHPLNALAPVLVKCRKCGLDMSPNTIFCPKCGEFTTNFTRKIIIHSIIGAIISFILTIVLIIGAANTGNVGLAVAAVVSLLVCIWDVYYIVILYKNSSH
jgi:RNA polymerase subunit RPABC4/transcription elongation factor Spt4